MQTQGSLGREPLAPLGSRRGPSVDQNAANAGVSNIQSAFSTPSGTVHRSASDEGGDGAVTSPLKSSRSFSGRYYFEILLKSPMFKKADTSSASKEDHGIKLWLLHNIVFVFIVKAGRAALDNLYAGKQDGIAINNIFKPKVEEVATSAADLQAQSGVRSASGLVVDLPTLQGLANASSSARNRSAQSQQQAQLSQQIQDLLNTKSKKPASQLANTFRDGDHGDKGVRRRFLVLNDRFLSPDKKRFSFTAEWATIRDRGIDESARKLFEVFETAKIEEWDFEVGAMLDGEYGVAPWSTQIKILPQTPASHNLSSGEEILQPVAQQLPFCTYDLPDSFEVRVSRPFRPFESRKEVPIQTCEVQEDALPPKYVLTLGGRMPEYIDWDHSKVEKGLQQKQKYEDIKTANFPSDDWVNEIALPYCIDQSQIVRSVQAGNFVVSFKKRPLLEKRKLIMNEDDKSDDESDG